MTTCAQGTHSSMAAIPPELRERRQWVGWHFEERDGKKTKIPVRVDGTANASTTDSATWGTFAQAFETARRGGVDGIGYVFSKDDSYVGVDLDACIDGDGRLHSDAGAIISSLSSYTEMSVSGAGAHVIVRAALNGSRNRTTNTGWGGDFECYGHSRYFCFTGDNLRGTPTTIEERQDELDQVLARIFPTPAADDDRPRLPLALPLELDDEELLNRARSAKNGASLERLYRGDTDGYGSHSEADLALVGALAFWTGPDPARLDSLFRRSGLMRPKWDAARGESTYGQQTIDRALEGRSEFYSGGPDHRADRERTDENGGRAGGQPARKPRAATDLGNAELFAEVHARRLRHVKERRQWLVWQEGRWRQDLTGEAERAAKQIARERLLTAADLTGEEQKKAVAWAMASQSEPRIRAMLALASTESEVVLRADDLDVDPYLLACGNGVINLRTGTLRPPDPDDLISLGTNVAYNPDATYPRWQRFLEEVFDGDKERITYIQRLVGYFLTGDTREQIVPVFHGSGANGKDTFIRPIMFILGDLAQTCPFDTFTRIRGDRGVRNDLARLHRARLVIASESAEGRRFDEPVIKLVSGGGRIAARFLYGEYFEYVPRFKVVLITNYRPRVDGDDDAIWRRLRLIPFDASFVGREDKTLDQTLEAELPGILNWAIKGCLNWQTDGLGTSTAVDQATSEYRIDEDVLGAFIADKCTLNGQARPTDLREAYDHFCHELGEKPLAATVLGKRLARRGIKKGSHDGSTVYHGITLKP
jgi:putative DNA primase/helicase